ncbi:MAG TPA: tannase/feruloyl esterase family alpha/beta hydrolase [Bryobacteraceae bacterium]|jgi:feruloyl esterase|nr:tannase/feruloyl esterase family alpha/beta hydrolase [Bryobacteraceae bacterium]
MRALWLFLLPAVVFGSPCDGLTGLTIPDTTIISATAVGAGPISLAGMRAPLTVTAFCRVLAVLRPTSDSEIHFEVWIPPADAWNGKFEGTGNGGFSSAMEYNRMAEALNRGYATAGSDTGHEGGDLKFGVGHAEKINDWAYRAVHVMTDESKLILRAYYGRFPQYSYFNGCSTGGHQALSEAQRYPDDYDGIVAGDPGNNRIHLMAGFLWAYSALYKDSASPLPAAKLPLINKAAVAACDANDGVKDGIIGDPRRCKFDPGVLLCRNGDDASCLTAPQVEAVRKIYSGPVNARTGEKIFAGFPRGSETGWPGYFVDQPSPSRNEFWKLWVFNFPDWDWRTFDFDRDLAYADKKMAAVNALDTNLAPFKAHKGKLVMYHGWADPVVPPEDGVRYYEAVQKTMGGAAKTDDFFRLFMAPGMGHCAGGVGPNSFDAVGALDQWVSKGEAPRRIVATHSTAGKVDRSRPLCPYPQEAVWKGSGSTDEAASFSCMNPGARP